MSGLKDFINEGRESHGLKKEDIINESKVNEEIDKKKVAKMSTKELLAEIKPRIEKTHNDKDKEDLLTFSDDELKTTLIELIEMNESTLNEGAKDHKPVAIANYLISILKDAIRGFKGDNATDTKHPNQAKVNKHLREAMKSIKAAKKEIKEKGVGVPMDAVWFDDKKYETYVLEEIEYDLEDTFSLLEKELSPLQKEYKQYFEDTLKEFDTTSPAKLTPEKKIEFFNAIKAGWVVGKGKKGK